MPARVSQEVVVNDVRFPKCEWSESTFCIFTTDICVCKGKLNARPHKGMKFNLVGTWEEYHGEVQFSFKTAKMDVPTDKKTLLHYCSRFAKGIGDKRVEHIWNTFGKNWDQCLNEMETKYATPLREALAHVNRDKDETEAKLYVLALGATDLIANKAYSKWKAKTITTLESNIYALAQLGGVGFVYVDTKIVPNEPKDSLRRNRAALQHYLTALMNMSGSTAINISELYANLDLMGGFIRSAYEAAFYSLLEDETLFKLTEELITTNKALDVEKNIYAYITKTEQNHYEHTPDTLSTPPEFILDESQEKAILNALNTKGVSVINGGAGCGKTTIIKIINNSITNCKLCAFAGKAAARLREATGDNDASTIHSLLIYMGEEQGFTAKSLEDFTVVVDEASMVPAWLLKEITSRNPERLILIGDQAQLQPVGIGSPFHDIISYMPQIVSTVTTCYRNKASIYENAYKVRNGKGITFGIESNDGETFQLLQVESPQEAHNLITNWVRNNTFDFHQDIIITPKNGDGDTPVAASVNALNRDIVKILFPEQPTKFATDNRVICTKNKRALSVWNGTTATVDRYDEDGKLYLNIDDSQNSSVLFAKEDIKDLQHAYALTIHKSQGSQYRNVVVCLFQRDTYTLMERQMLYTAITRARTTCCVIADCDPMEAIRKVAKRKTIMQLLLGASQ